MSRIQKGVPRPRRKHLLVPCSRRPGTHGCWGVKKQSPDCLRLFTRSMSWRAAFALLCLPALSSARPALDAVHSLMEAAIERPRLPHLKLPTRHSGLGALLTPKRAVVLLPAVLGGMAVVCPDVLAGLLVQLICYIGSLFEPFDSVLPEKGLLRTLVTTVQRAKKAYNVKHGLISIDEQQFFDDEDASSRDEAADGAAVADDGEGACKEALDDAAMAREEADGDGVTKGKEDDEDIYK